jgi:hypothetical protein
VVLLRQAVVRAGLRKPETGAGITDASLPHGRLQVKADELRCGRHRT